MCARRSQCGMVTFSSSKEPSAMVQQSGVPPNGKAQVISIRSLEEWENMSQPVGESRSHRFEEAVEARSGSGE